LIPAFVDSGFRRSMGMANKIGFSNLSMRKRADGGPSTAWPFQAGRQA
jgi:hypothetical protein